MNSIRAIFTSNILNALRLALVILSLSSCAEREQVLPTNHPFEDTIEGTETIEPDYTHQTLANKLHANAYRIADSLQPDSNSLYIYPKSIEATSVLAEEAITGANGDYQYFDKKWNSDDFRLDVALFLANADGIGWNVPENVTYNFYDERGFFHVFRFTYVILDGSGYGFRYGYYSTTSNFRDDHKVWHKVHEYEEIATDLYLSLTE